MIENRVWTEAHRPDTLDEVIGNEQQVSVLKDYVDKEGMPNILLEGPAGTGKTASARAFAQDVFGDSWRSNFIDFNASDNRGIDIVRNSIKDSAKEAPAMGFDYKIIFLDECGNLTQSAQSALRRIMENYSDQTVFFLSCNYKNKLIDPIQSRCVPLSFNRLSDSEINQIIYNIISGEDIEYEEDAVDMIIEYVQGDARRAVNTLQASVTNGELTQDGINFANTQASREDIQSVINLAVNGEMKEAMDTNMTQIVPEITDYGKFCKDLVYAIRNDGKINEDIRWYLISEVGKLEQAILDGANPEVQINSYIAKIPTVQYSSMSNYE